VFGNNSYATFNTTANMPTGDYSVKIRNAIGESNGINLNIRWNIGSSNSSIGSTQGNIVSFSGGSGFPATLSSSYYVTVYNSANDVYYDNVVISCCSSNTAVIAIPAAQHS
jgi:hypothetical protein